jgi:hypothetical protein
MLTSSYWFDSVPDDFFSLALFRVHMSNPQQYFYPAASFPSATDQTSYTIGGELITENTPSIPGAGPALAPRPNPHPSGDVPEAGPSQAPPTLPVSVPVATPTPVLSTVANAINNATKTTTKTTTTTSSAAPAAGINPISNTEAIAAMQKMQSDHPDNTAVTTSVPSVTTPDTSKGISPPASPDTMSTMATATTPSTVPVVDSVTNPAATK